MRKLINLFVEDVEDEEEVKEVPIVKHEFKEEPKKEVNKEVVQSVKKDVEVENKTKQVKENDVLARKIKPNFNIDLNEGKRQSFKTSSRTETYKFEKKPPISPMFGVLEEKHDNRIVSSSIVGTAKKTTASRIGTVLSPIYGSVVIEEAKLAKIEEKFEESKRKEEAEKLELPKVDTVNTKQEDYFKEYFTKNDKAINEINNRPINDILVSPEDETKISEKTVSLFEDIDD